MIELGDLVVVVRQCCTLADGVSAIFKVSRIAPRNVLCQYCGYCVMGTPVAFPDGRCRVEHSPVAWLKKIDPLAEEQLTEGVESVDGCTHS